jgi:hypothetical protein
MPRLVPRPSRLAPVFGRNGVHSKSLIRQTAELPEEAHVEVVQSLIEMRAQGSGVYQLDDDEREALARSEEDVRLGRFASEDEINQRFSRYGA